MTGRTIRVAAWTLAAALVILVTRTLAYAVSPSPVAELLQHRAGGPALPVVTLVAISAGAAFAVAIVFLAWLAVHERALLERRTAPRLNIARVYVSALALFALTAPAGALLEAYVHWRSGLGWHGLHCAFGPVHRDLLPIDAALSLVATAIAAAARHVWAWARRTFELLAKRTLPVLAAPVDRRLPRRQTPRARRLAAASARAPPALS